MSSRFFYYPVQKHGALTRQIEGPAHPLQIGGDLRVGSLRDRDQRRVAVVPMTDDAGEVVRPERTPWQAASLVQVSDGDVASGPNIA
jgi:hypothetical protein